MTDSFGFGPMDMFRFWAQATTYWVDAWQRTILTADVLRERANNMLDHAAQGMPPLLSFPYEILLDGRTQNPPVNYALLKITPPEGWKPLPGKRPVVVIDPRAGHGPGIGGFKEDSEVGISIEEGHPTYFVSFFPHPCPGQTLADVERLEAKFLEIVHDRHADLPSPIVYGNCQAGWAVAMLGADRPDVTGPMVLNGAPLSYWAGEEGINPMRVTGGLMGGSWTASLLADLNAGELDGIWLVENFENLNPGNTHVGKPYRLFDKIDTERERFLKFERWWTGFYFMGEREIQWIAGNLFVGNNLEQGELELEPGLTIDLKQMDDPLVVFASSGDNITPPHQALHWIWEVYKTNAELKKHGQRIVYLLNPHVGHLGIFVSARVAHKEHRAIIESVQRISELPPGLYEMKIVGETGEKDPLKDQWVVEFEERDIESVRFPFEPGDFEYTEEMSDLMLESYRTFMQPWIKAMVNPAVASWMRWLHPGRLSRMMWSERMNPAMALSEQAAAMVRAHRQPVEPDNAFRKLERTTAKNMQEALDEWTKNRDAMAEWLFKLLPG